jgi:hypothetical protein
MGAGKCVCCYLPIILDIDYSIIHQGAPPREIYSLFHQRALYYPLLSPTLMMYQLFAMLDDIFGRESPDGGNPHFLEGNPHWEESPLLW